MANIDDIYYSFINGYISSLKSDQFYDFFVNAVSKSEYNSVIKEKFIERKVDLDWVEKIEDTIISLDYIIRNPNRYIKNVEEIEPIERVRKITPDSVRHLATHTSFIGRVKGDEITPKKMLSIYKEESFDTYENRFIKTLVGKIEYFMDKRMVVLLENRKSSDKFSFNLDGKSKIGTDDITYTMNMDITTPHIDLTDEELRVDADVKNLTSIQRVERLRKILQTFHSSFFLKEMHDKADVRPPLVITNVLAKNQYFKKCVELWSYIDKYTEAGFFISNIERERDFNDTIRNDLFSVLAMEYVVAKKNVGNQVETKKDYDESVAKKDMIKTTISEIIEKFDFEIEEVRRIFNQKVLEKKKRQKLQFIKIRDIILRACECDNSFLIEEKNKRISSSKKSNDAYYNRREGERAALIRKRLEDRGEFEDYVKRKELKKRINEQIDTWDTQVIPIQPIQEDYNTNTQVLPNRDETFSESELSKQNVGPIQIVPNQDDLLNRTDLLSVESNGISVSNGGPNNVVNVDSIVNNNPEMINPPEPVQPEEEIDPTPHMYRLGDVVDENLEDTFMQEMEDIQKNLEELWRANKNNRKDI